MITTPKNQSATNECLLQNGKMACKNGAYNDALGYFNQILQADSAHFWARLYRGETYRLLNCQQNALTDFDIVLAQKPNHDWALAHRGAVYRALKRHQAALADLTKALAHRPNYAWALAQRTNVLVALCRHEEALLDMDRLIDIEPGRLSPWQGERGLLLNFLGRYKETIACCQPKVNQDQTDFFTHYSLVVAQTLLPASRAKASMAKLEKTLHDLLHSSSPPLNPQREAAIRYRLGGIHALQGNFQLANSYLQDAILLDDEPNETFRHDPAWKRFHLEHPNHS